MKKPVLSIVGERPDPRILDVLRKLDTVAQDLNWELHSDPESTELNRLANDLADLLARIQRRRPIETRALEVERARRIAENAAAVARMADEVAF